MRQRTTLLVTSSLILFACTNTKRPPAYVLNLGDDKRNEITAYTRQMEFEVAFVHGSHPIHNVIDSGDAFTVQVSLKNNRVLSESVTVNPTAIYFELTGDHNEVILSSFGTSFDSTYRVSYVVPHDSSVVIKEWTGPNTPERNRTFRLNPGLYCVWPKIRHPSESHDTPIHLPLILEVRSVNRAR